MKSIKELRLEHNIKPPQMAEKLNVALSTYFDKEAGRRKFNQSEIVVICTMFNKRVEHIKDFAE